LDCLAKREILEFQDQEVLMVKTGILERKEYRVILARVDLMVNLDLVDHQELLDCLAKKGLLERKARRDFVDHQNHQDK
jgi:hypothetical protein